MNIDLRQVRPGKLAGLLNSTPLGEVTTESRVRRNVVRAGLRVGDGKRVNVLGYAAWLLATWHGQLQEAEAASGLTGYEAMKEQARARNAALSTSGRDIGEIPAVVDPQRKGTAATANSIKASGRTLAGPPRKLSCQPSPAARPAGPLSRSPGSPAGFVA